MRCDNGKERYLTEEDALRAAAVRARIVRHEINVYVCQRCGAFHLTKFPQHLIARMAAQNEQRAM